MADSRRTRFRKDAFRRRVGPLLAESGTVGRIALVAPTAADGRDTMVEGESGLLAISPNSNRPTYEPSKRKLTWPNGVIATLFASEEPERLRGPQFGAAWCDEVGAWRNVQATWDNLQFGLRLGKRPRQCITTTPRPIKLLRELIKRESKDVVVTRGSTYANRENLAPSFFTQIVRQYEGTRLGRQELNAEILEDVQGALWTRDLIEETRKSKSDLPPLQRIVVAIDPAVTVSETSDETGIIVAGLGVDGHGYVLEDASGKFSPIEWSRRAVALYHRYKADRIVAEQNQGGALVETTVRTVDPNCSFKGVHASKGKITRAEPIAALFEQHRAHIVGSLDTLEDQLCTFSAGSQGSPDRLDATVWALTELMVDNASSAGMYEHWRREFEQTSMDAAKPKPGERIVSLLAPPGIGSVWLLSGRDLIVPETRVIELTESDAAPLYRAGFTQASPLPPT